VRVRTLTPDYWAVRERIAQQVKEALDDGGIGIPFPQLDIHFDDIPALVPSAARSVER
jgi:small conductance mechanosensitive channel